MTEPIRELRPEPSTDARTTSEAVLYEIRRVIVGQDAMLERVLACVHAALPERPVFVSGDVALLEATPALAAWRAEGWLRHHASGISPAASVADFLAGAGPGASLVTTADHALLTQDMVADFLAKAAGADVAIGVVTRESLLKRLPQSQRTWLKFRGGAYSGANLFILGSPKVRSTLELWRSSEQNRKKAWRMLFTLGLFGFLGAVLRLRSLEQTVGRVGRKLGLDIRAVELTDPLAAVDVDGSDMLAVYKPQGMTPYRQA